MDGLHELPLTKALQREQRAFMKPLKYDARTSTAFPNVLQLDCGKLPMPIHAVGPFADPKESALKEKAAATSGETTWVWHTDKDMPAVPEHARRRAGVAGWDS